MGDDDVKSIIVSVLIIGFVAGFWLGGFTIASQYREQAIERGYAEHDSQTGEWEWKDDSQD